MFLWNNFTDELEEETKSRGEEATAKMIIVETDAHLPPETLACEEAGIWWCDCHD